MNAETNITAPAELLVNTPYERLKLKRHYPFRAAGSRNDDELMVVLDGVFGLYLADEGGKRRIVGLRFPGEAIFPKNRGRAGIWPLTNEGELALVRNYHPTAERRELEARATRRYLQIAHEWMLRDQQGADARIAHFLCELAVRAGTAPFSAPLILTQDQLADITAQTNVNVNRVLADLERQGLIRRTIKGKTTKGEYIFPDWNALCTLARFTGEYLTEETK